MLRYPPPLIRHFRLASHLLLASVAISLAIEIVFGGDVTCFPKPQVYSTRFSVSPQPQENSIVGCVQPLPCVAPTTTVSKLPGSPPNELNVSSLSVGDPSSGYHSMTVWAQHYNASSSSWEDLWTIDSTDSVERAVAASSPSGVFGATALLPGERYRFSTAWCRLSGSVVTCNCFNDTPFAFIDEDGDNTPDAQPATFPTAPVTLPTTQEALDTFSRPDTDPKRTRVAPYTALGGDGLGPIVWSDDHGSNGATGLGNGARIAKDSSGQTFAEVPWESSQVFQLYDASWSHSFSEIEFRPHCTPECPTSNPSCGNKPNPPTNVACTAAAINYRMDVQTRIVKVASAVYNYFAQVIYEPDFGASPQDKPLVRIYRGDNSSEGLPLLFEDANHTVNGQLVENAPAWNGTAGCTVGGTPTAMSSGLVAGLKNGGQVLARVEIRNLNNGHTQAYATVAWDPTATGYDKVCVWQSIEDPLDFNSPLRNAKGKRGFFPHHWDAGVYRFRAGSQNN